MPARNRMWTGALLLCLGLAGAARGEKLPARSTTGVAESLRSALEDPILKRLLKDVLSRNPDVLEARARARAAAEVAPQVRALPDPTARLTAYLLEPETRVGPQELSLAFSQAFPWFGTLTLREQAALEDAVAARSQIEVVRLQALTEARRWYHELSFLRAEERVLDEERRTLSHFEELARARYASGKGLQQAPIKIQAEITRIDLKLLDVEERRNSALAVLNSLRQRPGPTPLAAASLPKDLGEVLEHDLLVSTAWVARPEVAGAEARIAASENRTALARKRGKPNFTLGVGYTLVGHRQDEAGRAKPPTDDGEDILALTAAASLPIFRGKVRAGIEQAVQLRQAAGHGKAAVLSRIDREVTDLRGQLRISRERVRLHEGLLLIQAEQSLRAGLTAYSAGTASALELLDAERVLFAVRVGAVRARADHAIAWAKLEGAVAVPLRAIGQKASEEELTPRDRTPPAATRKTP